VGKRHRRIRARSATGPVAGAATEKPGSKPIAQKRPAQHAFSQGPCPGRPSLNPARPDQQPQNGILMPRNPTAGGWGWVHIAEAAAWLVLQFVTAFASHNDGGRIGHSSAGTRGARFRAFRTGTVARLGTCWGALRAPSRSLIASIGSLTLPARSPPRNTNDGRQDEFEVASFALESQRVDGHSDHGGYIYG
jgi:hypothetical protein